MLSSTAALKGFMKKIAGVVLILLGAFFADAQSSPPLTLERTITLLGVSGKFDHFAIDLAGNRLFVAATGNHSLEVIDLATDKVQQSISGLGKPHGLVWVADTHSLYVADGMLGELRVYQGEPLKAAGTIKLSDDADDMAYNSAAHTLYVGHGGSGAANPARIAVIDTEKFSLITDLPVSTHPEALDLDAQAQRVFANIADSSEVVVIDAPKNAISAHWKMTGASHNVPLAYDDEHTVLYVASRTPGTLLAFDGASGAQLSSVPAGEQADDLFYDPALRRVYVVCGAGEVDAYQVDSQRRLHVLKVTHTRPAAKTGLFVPSQNLLYVGVPGIDGHSAEISVYTTPKRGSK